MENCTKHEHLIVIIQNVLCVILKFLCHVKS